MSPTDPLTGGCACGAVRYRIDATPMIVHACHCRWCQRETGAAFAVNALFETDRIDVESGDTVARRIPSESGRGQVMVRCSECGVTLWSHYASAGEQIAFVRVGTLDEPGRAPPDVYIHVASRPAWLNLPKGATAFEGFYDPKVVWSDSAQSRFRALKQAPASSAIERVEE